MKNLSDQSNRQLFDTIIQLGLVFLIMVFCFMLMAPFAIPILWAIILAIIINPMFNFLQKKLKGRKSLAATIIVLFLLAVIIIPVSYFFSSVTTTAFEIKDSFDKGTLKIAAPDMNIKEWPLIGPKLYEFLYSLSTNMEAGLMKYQAQIAEISKTILGGIASSIGSLLQIILSIIIAGVLLVSTSFQNMGKNLIMRVSGDKGEEILDITVGTVYQVVKGILGVAVIQTIIQGVGLYFAGIPFAAVLTLLSLILSILQIGPIIINIGVIIYLFSTGDTSVAIFWSVYFALSGLSDNVLKPLLLGKGAMVPMLVIFLGVIGGFMMSGFIGLFVGPIVFSIGYKLFVSWLNHEI